jgi:hypothetical protein
MSDTIRLYKFMADKYATPTLERKRLKASLYNQLNDPFEFMSFHLPDRDQRFAWRKAVDGVFADKALLCFSRNWRNPLMWAHYADNHSGVCLGFDIPIEYAVKVLYREKRPKVDFAKLTQAERLEAIRDFSHSKFSHWSYENEYRVFLSRTELIREGELIFWSFSEGIMLREAIIGINSKLGSEEVSKLADTPGLRVHTARAAFRDFRIVRQLDPNRRR